MKLNIPYFIIDFLFMQNVAFLIIELNIGNVESLFCCLPKKSALFSI